MIDGFQMKRLQGRDITPRPVAGIIKIGGMHSNKLLTTENSQLKGSSDNFLIRKTLNTPLGIEFATCC